LLREMSCCVCVLIWLAGGLVSSARADEPGGPHECAAIENASARLACYDRWFTPPVTPAEAPEDDDGTAVAGPASSPADQFGLTRAQIEAREPEHHEQRLDRIEARVTGIRYPSTGERIITLDNGQVWRQTEATVRGPVREGDLVTIRRGALGSFKLVTPGGASLGVRRIE
jgi:hypothetical protein